MEACNCMQIVAELHKEIGEILARPTDVAKYYSEKDISHTYSKSLFTLHSLPVPQAGKIVGLIGPNDIGKTTALNIVSGNLKPNIGRLALEEKPYTFYVMMHFQSRGIIRYFGILFGGVLKTVMKPQDLDLFLSTLGRDVTVREVIQQKDENGREKEMIDYLDLASIWDRSLGSLSLGELQRVSCAVVCVQDCDVYAFDEPFSYLDMKQRLNAAKAIRSLIHPSKYILVADHDLSVLEYVSDFIHCLHGAPGVYGVVSDPYEVREGANAFLDGFLPTENVRIREDSFALRVPKIDGELKHFERAGEYPSMIKSFEGFKLKVEAGSFAGGEIIVLLGENGRGKTTFLQLVGGSILPDEAQGELLNLRTSYKPQDPRESITDTVRTLLSDEIYTDRQFGADCMSPLKIDEFINKEVKDLSSSEYQRLALVLCLGKQADVYLIDEPSSHLDCEERLAVAKVIKRFIEKSRKAALVVEHDFTMATFLADRIIEFEGDPSHETTANAPDFFLPSMNRVLQRFGTSLRRDHGDDRLCINRKREFNRVSKISFPASTMTPYQMLLVPDQQNFQLEN